MKRDKKNVRLDSNADTYPADPFGSYTGRPVDIFDTPVQDADDL